MLKNFADVDYDYQINDIDKSVKKVSVDIDNIQYAIDEKSKALKEKQSDVFALMKSLKPIDSSVEDLETLSKRVKTTETQKREMEQVVDSLDKDLAQSKANFEMINNKLESDKFSDIAKRMADYNFLIDKKNNTKSDIDRLKIEVQSKLDKIARLGDLDYDPNCEKCVNNVFVKDAIQTKEALDADKEKAGKLVGLLKNLENKIEIDENIPELHKKHREYALKSTQLSDQIRRIKVEIKSNVSDVQRKVDTLERLNESIAKSKRYKTDIEFNDKIQKDIDKHKELELQLESEIKDMNVDLHSFIGRKSTLEAKKNDIMQTIEQVKDLEEKYEAYKYYLMAVNKDGVSYDLISRILSTVESEVNDILSQIVDFTIVFEMDGKMVNNYICYGDDKSWSLELASGMERFISSLAIRIALTNISNLPRANFIAIDEGFGTLDSDNLNSLYSFLQYLKSICQFSLVISHIDTMRDFTDQLLEIESDNGFSRINF
jgi:exonuclease SbcC